MFSKISAGDEREKIYAQMVSESTEIQIQLVDNSLLTVKSYKHMFEELIIFRDLGGQPDNQTVIVSFNLKPERYFMKSVLYEKSKNLHLKLTADLYKLQRRKNFRMPLPKIWGAKFKLEFQNGLALQRKFHVNDLSSGGFNFEFTPNDKFTLEPNAVLEGVLDIPNRLTIPIKAEVRHSREGGTKAYPMTRVGAMHLALPAKEEQAIMNVLLEIHRELFLRLK